MMDVLLLHLAKSIETILSGKDPYLKYEDHACVTSVFGWREFTSVNFWKAVFAELLAQALFVFMVCLSTINLGDNVMGIAFAIGLAFMATVQITMQISGGHVNPAVTIAMTLARRVTVVRALFYVMAQSVGGIAGAAIVLQMTDRKYHDHLGVTSLSADVNAFSGLCIEAILTFVLVSVVLGTTDPNRLQFGSQPFVIGMIATLGYLTAHSYTGSSMNPSRSFGPAVVTNSWEYHWVYWVGPIFGAALAAMMYRYFLNPRFQHICRRKLDSLENALKNKAADKNDISHCTCDSATHPEKKMDTQDGNEGDVNDLNVPIQKA